ncbi:LuxR C-terminal-related transcriptional regulator [Pseudonocardia sp. RS11V-5]|uniref:LuxR C-terminal-related transcriptional regulator n=1 Tax=Pseudonocardia terrae TaxID=2905831 RepID=UPI001E4D0D68|nr:LuxR C-terminal-related transcriptional regulator [Pseudonocardia terrae]MCE3554474.1 LuxR C-terminal-related transcriptional regulator [Pseudonocardia terrae]
MPSTSQSAVFDRTTTTRSLRRPHAVGSEIRRARSVLELVARLTGWDGAPGPAVSLGPHAAEVALDAAQSTVVDALARAELEPADRARLSAVVLQVAQARTAIREAGLARRTEALASVQGVLDRLRSATSVGTLIDRAPHEIGRVGYDRCLVSKLRNGRWIARSAFVKGDPGMAEAMRVAGSEAPRQVDQQLIESELVRRRSPILVTDAQSNPRVHRELLDLTQSRAYVAAPFVVGRSVIGFVHVDSGEDGVVDEFDRDVLGMLAECMGHAFERAVLHERLQAIRARVEQYSSSVLDMVDEAVEADLEPVSRPVPVPDLSEADGNSRSARAAVLRSLTAREREVLELMAAGDTNARIASTLFVTEATVKAHVKHILRKLSAANRAEAVCRYLRG